MTSAYEFVKDCREIKAAVLEYKRNVKAIYEQDGLVFRDLTTDLDVEYSFVGYRTRLLQFLEGYGYVWDDQVEDFKIDKFGVLRSTVIADDISVLDRDNPYDSVPITGDLVDNEDHDIEDLIYHILKVKDCRGEYVNFDYEFRKAGLR